ncbi:hypothetical protein C8J24_1387 [Sphingomonas aerolata]|uniref:O-antigen ligase-like membrane protein n=1 Tax=Sphingomonas aerolata TaxID=185951 RepID=A0A2T4YVZ0_9SPHN|nr:hypothetical protein [Sphingomonas aerolata]PTM47980.1 hypothetical protein C8J24_1387 [Sphingomonas aerolata]
MTIAMPVVPHRAGEMHGLAVARCLVVIVCMLFLPSALRFHLGFSSYAPGVMAGCVLVIGLALFGVLGRIPSQVLIKGWLMGLMVLGAIAIHLGLSLLQWSADIERATTSLAGMTLMAGAAPIVFYVIMNAEDGVLARSLAIVRVALLVMVAMSMLRLQPVGLLSSERPVWPFTEPSHFALASLPFFIDATVRSPRLIRWVWLGTMAVIVLLLQSLSLAVGLAIAAVCSLGLAELIAFLIAALVATQFIDLSYYVERLDIGYSSTNLSSLVYLQGIELIQEALETTRGWGIAIQQLGFAPTNVLATEIIRRVGGGEQNLSDGSFLAVKFGAELGILGIALLGIYIFKLFWAIIHLRLIAGNRAQSPVGVTFGLSVFTAFFIELFVRGIGYFSGTVVMACASIGVVAVVKFVSKDTVDLTK